MQNIYCVSTRFTSQQQESNPRGFIRMKSDGRSFFAAPTLFDNRDIFSKLTPDSLVHLGVRALADGTFWVYWLHSPEFGTAVIPELQKRASRLSPRLVWPPLCLVGLISQALYARMLISGRFGWGGVMIGVALGISTAILFGLGLMWLWKVIQRMREPEYKKQNAFQSLLLAVQNGDYSMCVSVQQAVYKRSGRDLMATILARARHGKAENIPSHFSVMEGKVSDVTVSPTVIGYTAKHKRLALDYTLRFGEQRISYGVPEDSAIPNPASGFLHPFFIASGDEVRLVVNKLKGRAVAIYNKEDDCVYWDSDGPSPHATLLMNKIILFFTPGWQLAFWTVVFLWGGLSWYSDFPIPLSPISKFYWSGVSCFLSKFKALTSGFGLAMLIGPSVIGGFWLKRLLSPPMADLLAFFLKAFSHGNKNGAKIPYFIDTWRIR